HSFYQLTLQGAKVIPADIIAPTTTHNPIHHAKHHRILLSDLFAHPEALAFGKTEEKVKKELELGVSDAFVKCEVFAGNRTNTSIMLPLQLGESLSFLSAAQLPV
ncbi:hypothetical protein HYPSUDRAFT_130467, partial [Hypholoma sublateritium FD-334 SS-4]